MFFRRFLRKHTTRSNCGRLPLVRLGQGDFTRDIHFEDLAMPARTDRHDEQLDVRILTHEPAAAYDGYGFDPDGGPF